MRISLHGGISDAQAAPEAQLPQKASAALGNVLHHAALRETRGHRWSERDGHGAGLESRDGGSAVTSRLAPKPTDPALSPELDNATQRAHGTARTQTPSTRVPPSPLFLFSSSSSSQTHALTSMSVWKLNKSIFCQLLPSRARTFHA